MTPSLLLQLARAAAIAVLLGFSMLPIFWIAMTSIRPDSEVLSGEVNLIPDLVTFEHFTSIMSGSGLEKYLFNSVITAVATTAACLLLALPAAYALSRLRYPGRLADHVKLWVLSTRFVPPFAIAIPMFLMFRDLRLLDSLTGLVLAHTVFALPFAMWILQSGFDELSPEIEEAGLIDGCSRLGVFWHVALPLMKPSILCAAIFTLFLSWNEFLFALLLTVSQARTVPLLVTQFLTDRSMEWGNIAAVSLVASLPVVLFLLFAQRYLVQGLTAGAVK